MDSGYAMKRRVQFAEVDAAGVLYFAFYYTMMEEIECSFWRSIGLSAIQQDGDRRLSWPRVATNCEYYAPACFEDELELTLTIVKIGRGSVSYEVDFRRDGKRLALGHTTAAFCEMIGSNFRPVPIPDDLRAKMSVLLQTST